MSVSSYTLDLAVCSHLSFNLPSNTHFSLVCSVRAVFPSIPFQVMLPGYRYK